MKRTNVSGGFSSGCNSIQQCSVLATHERQPRRSNSSVRTAAFVINTSTYEWPYGRVVATWFAYDYVIIWSFVSRRDLASCVPVNVVFSTRPSRVLNENSSVQHNSSGSVSSRTVVRSVVVWRSRCNVRERDDFVELARGGDRRTFPLPRHPSWTRDRCGLPWLAQ